MAMLTSVPIAALYLIAHVLIGLSFRLEGAILVMEA